MVTVAIIGIMAASIVVGFNGFGASMKLRETTGVITDTMKSLELETVRRDYVSNTVHFEEDFLVVESEIEGQTLELNYLGMGTCTGARAGIELDNSSGVGTAYLAQRDQYGNNMEISSVSAGTTKSFCIDFLSSEESEWQYQAFNSLEASQIIRFIHFNIRRDDESGSTPYIDDGTQYSMKITTPYASKQYFDGSTEIDPPFTIKLSDGENEESVAIQ